MREEEIIELIRSRSETGAEELLRHYGPLLRYVVAPILPDARDREDCVSEAVMRVWENIDGFDPGRGKWSAWLTAIARNAALNRARGKKRREGAETEELTPDTPSPELTPEEQVLRRERSAALELALKRLDEKDRLIFYRKYYYLQPTAQIASELGLTGRAVEGRLYRLRKQLREMLGGVYHD